LKFGSLNLLEPSRPVQAFNGIALIIIIIIIIPKVLYLYTGRGAAHVERKRRMINAVCLESLKKK